MSAMSNPTAPSAVYYPPPPPPGYARAYAYAGLGSRFLAALIDLVVLGIIAAAVAIPLGLFTALSVLSGFGAAAVWSAVFGPFTLILWLLWLGYFTYFESRTGQTFGKRVLGIKVVAIATGRPPDLGHALLRSVLRILDWLPALYLIGFIAAASTTQRQRIGDILAETVVVPA